MIPYKITHDAKKDPMIKKASLFFSTEPSEIIEYRNNGRPTTNHTSLAQKRKNLAKLSLLILV